ncbi:dodecin domain-containing protein [uncultured Boseongicola sp.]
MSQDSFDDAVAQSIAPGHKTLRNLKTAWIKNNLCPSMTAKSSTIRSTCW